MTQKLSWGSSRAIAKALLEKFPGLNMLNKQNDALLERIKTLPIYKELPPLPESQKEVNDIFFYIKHFYIRLSADMTEPTSSVDRDIVIKDE